MRLLEHIGLDGKIIKIIEQLYTENEVKFTLGEISTEWIKKNDVGVRQGCVLSPTLFNCYLEELITRIRKCGKGVIIKLARMPGICR